jgi:hypothetical protein
VEDIGVNANYLSHPSYSVISISLAIRFTDAVVISGNRATGTPVHPNFCTIPLALARPQFTPHPIKPRSLKQGCMDASKYLPLTFDKVRGLPQRKPRVSIRGAGFTPFLTSCNVLSLFLFLFAPTYPIIIHLAHGSIY